MKRTLLLLSILLPPAVSAQDYVLPELPSGRMADFSPMFHAMEPARFSAEIYTAQQYLAVKGHPQTYHLALAGTPATLHNDRSSITFHGDVYSRHSGFRYDVHGAFGVAATVPVHQGWALYADLNYDFGYRHYAFHDVVTEHPDYNNVPDTRYFHTPTASFGFTYTGTGIRLGLAVNGSAVLPEADYSVGGTFFLTRQAGAYTNDAYRRMAELTPYINYTYYSYDRIGHTVTVGLNARYSFFHANVLYRATQDVQAVGLGAGFDLGKCCHLGYRFLAPFRFAGSMAGVAAHHLTFMVNLPHMKNRWR